MKRVFLTMAVLTGPARTAILQDASNCSWQVSAPAAEEIGTGLR